MRRNYINYDEFEILSEYFFMLFYSVAKNTVDIAQIFKPEIASLFTKKLDG